MAERLTVECAIDFHRGGRGFRKEMLPGQDALLPDLMPGRVPRVTRLMALAIRFERLLRSGDVADYAELAELGHVSRARITQIMNLLMLAPDIQEELLFLPRTERGRDVVHIRHLQPLALVADWRRQRRLWQELRKVK